MLIVVVLAVTAFCVFVERAQRRIPVDYAKRQVGRRMMAAQTTHLPFKLNMSGVIPPIFASSLLLFPATIAGLCRREQRHLVGPGAADVLDDAGLRPAAAHRGVRRS